MMFTGGVQQSAEVLSQLTSLSGMDGGQRKRYFQFIYVILNIVVPFWVINIEVSSACSHPQ